MDKTTEEKIEILTKQIADLSQEVYKNNFSSSQDFNKSSRFNTRLKVPHYDVFPPTAEVGELVEAGGALYICSTPNVFTLV